MCSTKSSAEAEPSYTRRHHWPQKHNTRSCPALALCTHENKSHQSSLPWQLGSFPTLQESLRDEHLHLGNKKSSLLKEEFLHFSQPTNFNHSINLRTKQILAKNGNQGTPSRANPAASLQQGGAAPPQLLTSLQLS